MKVTTERLEQCQVNIFVEMEAAEVDEKLRQTARNISRRFNVPGYRRGKAPYAAVVRAFGREMLQQEGMDQFGQELYEKALEETGLDPYQPGELKQVDWEPFRMTVLLPIKPEVELGAYRETRVPLEPVPVTDEQVAGYLEQLQKQHTQWEPVERPAAWADQVVIDSNGTIGDEEIWSDEAHEMVLDAEETEPVPGFNGAIVGMSPGEEKEFVRSFPADDPQAAVAGKDVLCRVKVHTVKERNVPPLDDDLAAMVGDYATLDELKSATQTALEAEARQKAESQYVDAVVEAMIEGATRIEYPPQAVDREAELALGQLERNLAASGIKLDTYLKMLGKTREAYKSDLRPAAERRLKKRLVLVEVARLEGVQVTSEEIDAEVARLKEALGPQDRELVEFLSKPEGHLSVADDLMMARITARIVEIGKGEAPPLEVPAGGDEQPAVPEGAVEQPETGASSD